MQIRYSSFSGDDRRFRAFIGHSQGSFLALSERFTQLYPDFIAHVKKTFQLAENYLWRLPKKFFFSYSST